MPRKTVILIPPSEGKAAGGRGAPWCPGTMAHAGLDGRRSELLSRVDGRVIDRGGPTLEAIERYTGVLYKELDATTLRGAPRRRLDRDVRIVSGLWGLVAPRDPLPEYRCKMSASVDGIGRLSTWWRPAITEALADRVRGAEVWDLLPIEHAAAVDWSTLAPYRRTTLRFVDASGKVVSHWNKLLKGSVVRWLVDAGGRVPEDLAAFDHPRGYELDVEASSFRPGRAEVVLRER